MSNLYGGMPGSKFILKDCFPSIEAMVAAFRLGPSYTNVWYEEYCLIDTANKNDKDNGKLYRRGYDYTNDMGGAEYLGQIVGPSSGTPYFQLNTLEEAHDKSLITLEEDEYRRYPYGKDSDGNYLTTSDGQTIADFSFNMENALIPGKDSSGNFNDEIIWTWVNIRKDNADADSWFYMGFKIPYLVVDYDAQTVSPYDENGDIKEKLVVLNKMDDGSHPYYENYLFDIAHGIKGDTLRRLRVITPTAQDVIYAESAITIRPDGSAAIGQPGYAGQQDDIDNQRQIIVYNYYVYDKELNPEPIVVYLADYNQEKGIQVQDDGTVIFSQTHDDDIIFEKKLMWVSDISLTQGNGAEGGHFRVDYNNGHEPYETDITWPKKIDIAEDGTVTITFAGAGDELTNHTTGIKTYENLLKWISQITLNTETGVLQVGYNNESAPYITTLDWIRSISLDDDGTIHFQHTANGYDEVYNQKIRWVTGATIDPTNGTFRMTFNNGPDITGVLDYVSDIAIDEDSGDITITNVNSGDTLLDAKLRKMVSAAVNDTGVVTLTDNRGDNYNLKKTGTQEDYHWRSIDNVSLAKGLTGDHHINIKYNDETTSRVIGDSLNWIQDVVVRTNDWHLLVLFTDPAHRPTAADLDINGKDANGNIWIQNVTGSDGTTTPSGIYWRDYGAIKDQSGVMIGTNITENDITSAGYTDIITYLINRYPNGITGSQAGKVVTYSAQLTDAKEFYAYDYNNNRWFFLGTISDGGNRDVALNIGKVVPSDTIENLNTKGLIFKVINTTKSQSEGLVIGGMPEFWNFDFNGWNNLP